MTTPSIDIVMDALARMVLEGQQSILSAATSIGADFARLTVREYYDENIDIDMYPLVMLQEVSENSDWYGLPAILRTRYSVAVWLFVKYDNPAARIKYRRAMSGELRNHLNRYHAIGYELPDGNWLEFGDQQVPISSIDYNVMGDDPTIRGARMIWTCESSPSIGDQRLDI